MYTKQNALFGTYQFSYHINSGNSIQLPSSDPGLNVLTDTIDLSSNAGSTVTYLCSYHSFSGTQIKLWLFPNTGRFCDT